MSIEKRVYPDGKPRYFVRIESHDAVTGERIRTTVGTYRTKRGAEDAERQSIVDRNGGALVKQDKTTVREVLERWLEVELPRTVRPENRQNYEIIVRKHLIPALGRRPVQKLSVEEVERFYASMQEQGYSASTIKKCHMRLSSALRMAKRWKLVRDNVCDDVSPPKTSCRMPEVWTPDEVAIFLTEAARDSMHPYWQLAMESGARTSELLGLTWADFDPERRTLALGGQVVRLLKGTPILKEDAKTAAGRRTIRLTLGMTEELHRHHTRWKARRLAGGSDWNPECLVFATASGLPINPAHIRRSFDRLVKAAGVKRITPHSMRRTHITHAIAAGANPKSVAGRVGHRDMATTLGIYTRLVPQMEDDLMEIVEALAARRNDRPSTA